MIEPYTRDDDSLDWKAIMLISTLFAAHSLDIFIIGVLLFVIALILLPFTLLAMMIFNYVRRVFQQYAKARTQEAHALNASGALFIITTVFVGYLLLIRQIDLVVGINLIATTFFILVLVVVLVDKAHQIEEDSNLLTSGSNVLEHLAQQRQARP